jgi:hypothetical protein
MKINYLTWAGSCELRATRYELRVASYELRAASFVSCLQDAILRQMRGHPLLSSILGNLYFPMLNSKLEARNSKPNRDHEAFL